ncbi:MULTISPECIES: hypothetical protein [unclassified Microbacterium]|nr:MULTISPECIES: hypothetical protein [unclassified Microbacterium]MBT2484797.1 hypothetical protein [Microbacterium sp. ISL-108]
MRYRIHYTLADGSEDSIVLAGDSIESIREQAAEELAKRGGTNPWSEEA